MPLHFASLPGCEPVPRAGPSPRDGFDAELEVGVSAVGATNWPSKLLVTVPSSAGGVDEPADSLRVDGVVVGPDPDVVVALLPNDAPLKRTSISRTGQTARSSFTSESMGKNSDIVASSVDSSVGGGGWATGASQDSRS